MSFGPSVFYKKALSKREHLNPSVDNKYSMVKVMISLLMLER